MNPNKNYENEMKNLRELVYCLQKENQQLKENLKYQLQNQINTLRIWKGDFKMD